jgi:hypothetical protein
LQAATPSDVPPFDNLGDHPLSQPAFETVDEADHVAGLATAPAE